METAVNLALDGAPLLGERVFILGQGIVGLLLSHVLSQYPLAGLYALDKHSLRRDAAMQSGASRVFDPASAKDVAALKLALQLTSDGGGADLIYELSGNPDALNLALELCAYSGTVIVGSWYGNKSCGLQLGERFHRNRIRLVSSQVSTLDPSLLGRWSKARRFNTAWDMLRSLATDELVTHQIPFSSASRAYEVLDQEPAQTLQTILVYPDN
jgi:threonine dehydrogenase-like Zn-dependent dehydrogenase